MVSNPSYEDWFNPSRQTCVLIVSIIQDGPYSTASNGLRVCMVEEFRWPRCTMLRSIKNLGSHRADTLRQQRSAPGDRFSAISICFALSCLPFSVLSELESNCTISSFVTLRGVSDTTYSRRGIVPFFQAWAQIGVFLLRLLFAIGRTSVAITEITLHSDPFVHPQNS